MINQSTQYPLHGLEGMMSSAANWEAEIPFGIKIVQAPEAFEAATADLEQRAKSSFAW